MAIELGQEVRDRVTGFQGIATVRGHYLQGCDRITVQPKVRKDGTLPEVKYFDEPDLEVVGPGVTKSSVKKPPKNPPGGPHDHDVPKGMMR